MPNVGGRDYRRSKTSRVSHLFRSLLFCSMSHGCGCFRGTDTFLNDLFICLLRDSAVRNKLFLGFALNTLGDQEQASFTLALASRYMDSKVYRSNGVFLTFSKHGAMLSTPESSALCVRCHIPALRSTCASNEVILMGPIEPRGPSHFQTRPISTWRGVEWVSTRITAPTS